MDLFNKVLVTMASFKDLVDLIDLFRGIYKTRYL